MDNVTAYDLPTDAEISAIESVLSFKFPMAYREFLKSGGDVHNALYEPALVRPGIERLYLPNVAKEAWERDVVPRGWLPFIQDNGDYFLVSPSGEVAFWSHNGRSQESWPSFEDWFKQCCVERR
ncbi:SMI1/KNR4 family protein [Acidovorax sp. LjRoot129]|uniref:SMI1/KNR4 family protein n=1 Tax=Acidovorax sp. LjRoot129 TaxID=3342260 RepID=UPI003ECF4BC9